MIFVFLAVGTLYTPEKRKGFRTGSFIIGHCWRINVVDMLAPFWGPGATADERRTGRFPRLLLVQRLLDEAYNYVGQQEQKYVSWKSTHTFGPSRTLYTQYPSLNVGSSMTAVPHGARMPSTDIFAVDPVNASLDLIS